jgi:hypothetical protein
MDKIRIGMVSYDQFREVINLNEVGLRIMLKNDRKKIPDSFDWEQNLIKKLLDWIVDHRLSLSEAFKLIDSDFDGTLSPQDLNGFL